MKGHDGLDFAVKCKNHSVKMGGQCEIVYCNITEKLKITRIQKDVKSGFGIVACTFDNMYKFLWWHHDNIFPNLKVGDIIELGTPLAIAGNTGKSTGAHVHFGMYSYYENYDNGYRGASDPASFYSPIFCLNAKGQIGIIKKIINLYWLVVNKLKNG